VPSWLNEGLAEYFSRIGRAVDGRHVLGLQTTRLLRTLQVSGNTVELVPFDVLFTGKGNGTIDQLYLTAWALVHYLANGAPDHVDRFRRFLLALARGRAWRDVLVEEYGPLPKIAEADRKHLEDVAVGKTLKWVIAENAGGPEPSAPVVRTLEDAEIHRMKAMLRPQDAEHELALAQKHQSDAPELHLWQATIAAQNKQDDLAEAELEKAVAARPKEYAYRWACARFRFERELRKPEAQQHLAALASEMRDVARHVSDALDLAVVGHFFQLIHDDALGRTFAERAVKRDPHCGQCLVTLGASYFAANELDDAIGALEAAVARWPHDEPVPDEVAAALEKYRRARDENN